MSHPGEAAALRLGQVLLELGEALDMDFVQHGLLQRGMRCAVVAPDEVVGHHAGLERKRCVIPGVAVQRVGPVGAKVFVAPFELAHHVACIRVQQ